MSDYRYITYKNIEKEIGLVTLCRSDKHNALNLSMIEELTDVFESSHQPRVILLDSEGSVFSSGLDLKEALDSVKGRKLAIAIGRLFTAIYTSSSINIAMVRGNAIAGGAGLAVACDFTIMSRSAHMGFPETRRGLIASQVSALLCRQMRMRDVRELLLLGELVDGNKALAIGLVNRIVDESELFAEAIAMSKIILMGAPKAIQETKNFLGQLNPSLLSKDLENAQAIYQKMRNSEEAQEGIAAFLEKRGPYWSSGY